MISRSHVARGSPSINRKLTAADSSGSTGNPRHAEWPWQIGSRAPEHNHSERDDHERHQRADADERSQRADRGEARGQRDDDAGDDRGDVGRVKARMHAARPCGQQAIARHRQENSRLRKHHHDHHRAERRETADCHQHLDHRHRAFDGVPTDRSAAASIVSTSGAA